MFIGKMSQPEFTRVLTPKLRQIIASVVDKLSSPIDDGRYELEGDRVFFTVLFDHTQQLERRRSECHRRYLDVQILLKGNETYGYSLSPFKALDDDMLDEKDLAFSQQLKDERFVDLTPGDFIIFYPGQPHRPLVATNNNPMPVRKAIIKIDKSILE